MIIKHSWLRCASLALASFAFAPQALALTVVEGNLLTGSSQNAEWLTCGSKQESVNISSLGESNCAFREVRAFPDVEYRLSCGVTPVDYASMTLNFLDSDYNELSSQVRELAGGASGAYSITMTAPKGTAMAAVTVYGEDGTGFQDCSLVNASGTQPLSEWTIKGFAWLDLNADSEYQEGEFGASGINVNLFVGDNHIAQTTTDIYGGYNFPGLSAENCYVVKFESADNAISFGDQGGISVVDASGRSSEICPTTEYMVIDWINASVKPGVTPPTPADSAICGVTWMDENSNGQFEGNEGAIEQLAVQLVDVQGNTVDHVITNAHGFYTFSGVPAGAYRIKFSGMSGYEFADTGNGSFLVGTNAANADGFTRQFVLPDENNSDPGSACTLNHVNAGYQPTPVALPPSIARDDFVSGVSGTTLQVNVLDNDSPCNGSVAEVSLLGHSVPGTVTLDPATGLLTITNVTTPGTYNVSYGIRGTCGSLGQAQVTVTIIEPTTSVVTSCLVMARTAYGNITGEANIRLSRKTPAASYVLYDALGEPMQTLFESHARSRTLYNASWSSVPGINRPVKFVRSIGIDGAPSRPVPCRYKRASPIALDLDGNGRIERLTGHFAVDMDADGVEENLASWFGPTDGILLLGSTESLVGKAVTGREMLGDEMGKFADGFVKLGKLDANSDSVVSGTELNAIMVWRDLNSDTIISADELSTLSSHGVVSLPVDHYKYLARATLESGKTMFMEDVWFPLAAPALAAGR